MKEKWQIFVDGASRGNPGPAGAGIYITIEGEEVLRKSFYLKEKTNNQAEYFALLLGLFFFRVELKKRDIDFLNKKNNPKVLVISDSELLVKQMKGEYKVKNPILQKLKILVEKLMIGLDCRFSHVLRKGNKVADELANIGIDKKEKIPVAFLRFLEKNNINFV
ncbi:reverse transcriptase-like protein [Candidatus Dependentiae bacterium]|nr:reverse transcriptase-like protein [Candidatus Dependentiae bacterium]